MTTPTTPNDFSKVKWLLKRDKAALKKELEAVGAQFRGGNSCCCPFHKDRNPSAGIYQAENGCWYFKCHPCNIHEDIIGIMMRVRKKTFAEIIRQITSHR